ncbi:tetratricopeptide repeat protein [Aquincola sp. S2]|uniref:Tetratricopeptide repeat protein n=1 Tax=Pseudaquabacterium terrae TaxID=2732868 RepID=A0ABX2ERQ7_9BURK|nr:tetratricopeptide repeat protein [Aquabacterium terrae]NRF71322.1 tetratricopeptide repeat protein [Aquabacterium terrae]
MQIKEGGQAHLGEILRLTSRGRAALDAGDGPAALEALQRKHNLVRKSFGDDHPSTGASWVDLGRAYELAGEFDEARAAFEEAQRINQSCGLHPHQLTLLEDGLKKVNARRGHTFAVEMISKAQIERLRGEGDDAELMRACAQDEQADLLMRSGRFAEALPLALDSLAIFERRAPNGVDEGICCRYLMIIHRGLGNLAVAAEFGRRGAACLANARPGSESAITLADELAVTLTLLAVERGDPLLASEALNLSVGALELAEAKLGEKHKASLRIRSNRAEMASRLSHLCANALRAAPQGEASSVEVEVALPTRLFISHRYSDSCSRNALLKALPSYVHPVVFEPVSVSISEFVSEKLISGVLGADGLVAIDSEESNASFWTAFERDLAMRNGKPLFAFDPKSDELRRHSVELAQLMVAHCWHPDDRTDVDRVIQYLADERGFDVFGDVKRWWRRRQTASIWGLPASRRDQALLVLRSLGANYLVFASQAFLEDKLLVKHAAEQLAGYPESTLLCWLDDPSSVDEPPVPFREADGARVVTFSRRPSSRDFRVTEIDDLMVRLYWLTHQRRATKAQSL